MSGQMKNLFNLPPNFQICSLKSEIILHTEHTNLEPLFTCEACLCISFKRTGSSVTVGQTVRTAMKE